MIRLRDYQETAVLDLKTAFAKDRRVLLALPTGAGKTIIFTYISAGVCQKQKRVLIIAHRRELLKQISDSLRLWHVPHGILDADSRGIPRANVIVASVFTLARRLDHFPIPDLIIGDEAHHFAKGSTWHQVVTKFPKARVLGVTATPTRLDGKGLHDSFDALVTGPSVSELTALGWLSPAEVYAPKHTVDLRGLRHKMGDYDMAELDAMMDKPAITGNAVEHYRRLCPGKRAVAFCCSIRHAIDVAIEFKASGIEAAHIDGSMDNGQRDAIISAFRRGEVLVLTSCDLISEGFDLPAIECAILLRPTKSLGLYMQQVGRSIRPFEGKTKTIILDHAGNTALHGFIDEERNWTLDGARETRDSDPVARVRTCPKCFAMHRPTPQCPRCGYVYVVKSREVDYIDDTLERVSSPEDIGAAVKSGHDAELISRYNILRNIAKRRGYENPDRWAFTIIASEEARRRHGGSDKQQINGLSYDERDKLAAILRQTDNKVEVVHG